MPIPKPLDGEEHDDFIARCTSDPVMVAEYDDPQRYAICESAWKDAHPTKALPLNSDAMGRRMLGEKRQHVFGLAGHVRQVEGEDDRVVEVAISSETPVERWFGQEILSHEKKAVDVSFLNSGRAPLLLGHNHDKVIGVIEKVKLDTDERILRAKVRFGQSDLSTEILTDVRDGIRSNLSIGYIVREFDEQEVKDGETPIFVATRWQPYEASFVAVGADPEAFVGRSGETHISNSEEREMPDKTPTPASTEPKVEVNAEQIRSEERQRTAEITTLGRRFGVVEAAEQFVRDGRSVAEFKDVVLTEVEKRNAQTKVQPVTNLDMESNQVRKYSLMRALRASLNKDWSDAGLEREASREIAKRLDRESSGFFLPDDYLRQYASIRVMDVANNSGELVGTDHLAGEYISPLYNRSVLRRLGARVLSGLVGNVEIPRGASATVYWLATEDTAITESTPNPTEVTLSPKVAGALVRLSHKLMRQSSPSVEAMVRQDLLNGMTAAIDGVAINGGGSGEPTGILQTSGIGAASSLGATGGAPTFAMVNELIREVAVDNVEGTMGFLTNPKVDYKLSTTPKVASTDSVMIKQVGQTLLGYPFAVTNGVPSTLAKSTSGNVLSALIYGDYSQVMIGEWGVIELNASDSGLTDDFAKGKVAVRALVDVDVAVRYPEAFSSSQEIATT